MLACVHIACVDTLDKRIRGFDSLGQVGPPMRMLLLRVALLLT